MSKFILALDQATKTTGYAIFKDKQLIKYGHLTPDGKDYIERFSKLRNWVEQVIDTLDCDIEVAIEDIQLQTRIKENTMEEEAMGVTTYKKLAHVQGALLSLFVDKQIIYTIVSSNTWKSYCKIKGKQRQEQKRNAQAHVKEVFGVTATQDEADAICIGEYISAQQGFDWSD